MKRKKKHNRTKAQGHVVLGTRNEIHRNSKHFQFDSMIHDFLMAKHAAGISLNIFNANGSISLSRFSTRTHKKSAGDHYE